MPLGTSMIARLGFSGYALGVAKTLLHLSVANEGFQQSPTELLHTPGSFYDWEGWGV